MSIAPKKLAILVGGGPAPGINSVIGASTIRAVMEGVEVIGIMDGFQWIMDGDISHTKNLTIHNVSRIHFRGGSYIGIARANPTKDKKHLENTVTSLLRLNVDKLITIGGDDTASTANRISKFLTERKFPIQNIHVPKTIDNDLPLPEGQPTFGYQSAKQEGVRIGRTIYEDARTSGNWFVVSAMGREAGHLAFGIGAACHYPMIIIPEMFNKTKLTLDKITRLIISSIVKRKILGIPYGVAIVSEGVFHFLSDDEIEASGIQFTYDEHGHPELGTVSKAHIYNMLLQIRLKQLGLNIKSRPVEMGYELRCIPPTAFDLLYCSLLGIGVKKIFDEGLTGCIVSSDPTGDITPLFLKDLEDGFGRVRTRMVTMDSQKARMVFLDSIQYLTNQDMETAKEYLKNPEEFNFFKILEW